MADVYVWSGATGAGTGADWANAYITLEAAATAKAAGDTFWVAHDHVQTAAVGIALAFPGTEVLPNRVYCVNRAGSVPPVAADLRTTGQINTTLNSTITLTGAVAEINGLIFNCGSGGSGTPTILFGNTANRSTRLVNCSLRIGHTSTGCRITLAASASANVTVLENTTVQFNGVLQAMQTNARAIWRNTPNAILGAVIPTTLVAFPVATGDWVIEGVDLSAAGAGKTLFATSSGGSCTGVIKDCKINAAVAIAASPSLAAGGVEISLYRCDSGAAVYRTEKYSYAGTQTTETTIVRTDGASDGTTPYSWKIVTTANSKWEWPFESLPITIWNETVGTPVTVTVEGIWGGGATPLNNEIWIEAQHYGSIGSISTSVATSGTTSLQTGTNLPAGSGTWGGSTTRFKMSTTLTPQVKGPITVYVRAAKASSTFYVDPKVLLT
jgi:hypothetical protein